MQSRCPGTPGALFTFQLMCVMVMEQGDHLLPPISCYPVQQILELQALHT